MSTMTSSKNGATMKTVKQYLVATDLQAKKEQWAEQDFQDSEATEHHINDEYTSLHLFLKSIQCVTPRGNSKLWTRDDNGVWGLVQQLKQMCHFNGDVAKGGGYAYVEP